MFMKRKGASPFALQIAKGKAIIAANLGTCHLHVCVPFMRILPQNAVFFSHKDGD